MKRLNAVFAFTGVLGCLVFSCTPPTQAPSQEPDSATLEDSEKPARRTNKDPFPEGPGAVPPPESTSDASPAETKEPVVDVTGPFPPDLKLHVSEEVRASGDRNLRVAHAEEANHRAIVYLHGMCGNPKGADPWIDIATQLGTVITVRGNVPCPDRPGYKWPKEAADIQPRIDAALSLVKEMRGGRLITEEVLLVGYSQGAHRAEKLAAAFPDRYPNLVLGGPPTEADPENLHAAQSVAILGGELENTEHMEAGQLALSQAGLRSEFFLLPKAHHGAYGPEGRRVMKEVFDWLELAK